MNVRTTRRHRTGRFTAGNLQESGGKEELTHSTPSAPVLVLIFCVSALSDHVTHLEGDRAFKLGSGTTSEDGRSVQRLRLLDSSQSPARISSSSVNAMGCFASPPNCLSDICLRSNIRLCPDGGTCSPSRIRKATPKHCWRAFAAFQLRCEATPRRARVSAASSAPSGCSAGALSHRPAAVIASNPKGKSVARDDMTASDFDRGVSEDRFRIFSPITSNP